MLCVAFSTTEGNFKLLCVYYMVLEKDGIFNICQIFNLVTNNIPSENPKGPSLHLQDALKNLNNSKKFEMLRIL